MKIDYAPSATDAELMKLKMNITSCLSVVLIQILEVNTLNLDIILIPRTINSLNYYPVNAKSLYWLYPNMYILQ